MSNENLNHNSWRARLEVMDGLEGESPLDKNASWDRLYDRLNKKKQSLKARGFWLAAASVLAAVITALFIYSQKSTPINESPTITLTEKKVENEIKSNSSIDHIIPDSPVLTDNPPIIKNENLVINKKSGETVINIPVIRVMDTVSSVTGLSTSMALAPIEDSMDHIIAIVPAKKKLKVVHINAIDEPKKSPQNLAKGSGKGIFQLNFGDQQVLESPINSKNKKPSLFEIKTSLN